MSKIPIFISYHTSDAAFAAALKTRLRMAGFNFVPMDDNALTACKVLIAVMSNAAIMDDNAGTAWKRAVELGKPVVTVLVDDVVFLPPALARRQPIDFSGHKRRAMSRLREQLIIIDGLHTDITRLQALVDELTQKQEAAPYPPRVAARLRELREQIAYKQTVLHEPDSALAEYYESTQASFHAVQEAAAEQRKRRRRSRRRRVIGTPLQSPASFKGRRHELVSVLNTLLSTASDAPRAVCIYGQTGTGKTSLANRVMQELEKDAQRVHGLIYLSTRSGLGISLEQIYIQSAAMLGGEINARLNEIWTSESLTLVEKIEKLLDEIGNRRCVLLLDNLEDLLTDEGRLEDAALRLFVDTFLARDHGGRLLITSRQPLVTDHSVADREYLVPLDEGLPIDLAIDLLQSYDLTGDIGLRDASRTILARIAVQTHGFPRALEALTGMLVNDPLLALDQLVLENETTSGTLVEHYVHEAQARLDRDSRFVMQALAVYGRPVSAAAVQFMLEPFIERFAIDVILTLKRLVRGRYVTLKQSSSGGEYVLHPLDIDYNYRQIPTGLHDDYNLEALERRAANYYLEMRAPRDEWLSLIDLDSPLAEFEHRLRAGSFDKAADLLNLIDFDYLSLWGHARRVMQMRERLIGKITKPELESANYNNLGLAYSTLSQYDKAAFYYDKALQINQELEREGDTAVNLSNLGTIFSAQGDRRKAIDYQTRALEIFKRLKNRKNVGTILSLLGGNHYSLGNLREALNYYEEALKIAREVFDRRGEGNRLSNLGGIYHDMGKPEKAREHYEQALKIAREIGDRINEGSCLACLGGLYSMEGDPDKAERYYEQSLTIDREIGNRAGESARLNNLGGVYSTRGQPRKALAYYEQALKIDREVGNRAGEGNRLGNIGDIYTGMGQYNKAIDYQLQSLAISRETGIRYSEGAALASLGWIYSELRRYQDALDYYRQSLDIARQIGDRYAECNRLGNLGSIYTDLGRHQEALRYHQKSLDIAKEISDPTNQAVRLMWLAWTHADLGEYDRASELLDQGLAITRRISNWRWEENHHFAQATLHLARKNYDHALTKTREALNLAKQINNPSTLQSRETLIAEIYLYQNRLDEALKSIEGAMDYDTPAAKRRHTVMVYAVILTRLRRVEAARSAYEAVLEYANDILAVTPDLFAARYSVAHAYSGLALLSQNGRRQQYIEQARQAYEQAIQNCDATGVVQAALRLFSQIQTADPDSILDPVRAQIDRNSLLSS